MTPEEAKENLDKQLHEILNWHFSEDTGTPFWLDWKKTSGWDPREEIKSFDDIHKFDHFQDEYLPELGKVLIYVAENSRIHKSKKYVYKNKAWIKAVQHVMMNGWRAILDEANRFFW